MKLDNRQLKKLNHFETSRPALPGQLDEVLVADVRDGLTPADMVERRLLHLLGGQSWRVVMHGGRRRVQGYTNAWASEPGNFATEQTRHPRGHVMRVIQQGDKVQVHYVKVFQDGSTVSSRGKAPTEVTVGTDHPRLPGLGLTLIGLTVGESRTLIVRAQDAYGPFNPRRIRRIARWRFAEHEDLSVGQWVRVWDRQHRRRLVRIMEIGKITVIVDANHRWAGQSLELEVKVIAIRCPEGTSSADDGPGDTSSADSLSQQRIFGSMMPVGQSGGDGSCP